jgi:hypothetical protein
VSILPVIVDIRNPRPPESPLLLLVGVAIGIVPLILAYWPRIAAWAAARGHEATALPAGVSPLVAAELCGLRQIELLATGLMEILAGTDERPALERLGTATDPSAEGMLRESLAPRKSSDQVRAAAREVLASDNPAGFEARAIAGGISGWIREDHRRLGLRWEPIVLRRVLLVIAAVELLIAGLIDGIESLNTAYAVGGVITLWAATHIDTRTRAGAALTGELRSLRGRLRDAALSTGSIDSEAVTRLLPWASGSAEVEVWAVAVGCKTNASEQTAAHVRSVVHAAAGKTGTINYSEAAMEAAGRLAGPMTAPFRTAWRRIRPARRGPNGAAPVLW